MRQAAEDGRLARVAIAVGALVWLCFLVLPHLVGRAGLLDPLEYRLLDARYRLTGPVAPAPEVVIVAVDDALLARRADTALNGRARLAFLIDRIANSGAKALAIDVLLADAGEPAEDLALAEALGRMPSAIAAAATFDGQVADPAQVIWPQDTFRAVASAGLVNISTDAGGTPRFAPLLLQVEDALLPALALVGALSFSEDDASVTENALAIGAHEVPLDGGYNMPLRYVGPGGSVPTLSATALLEGPQAEVLSGKMVVLGFTAAAMGDRFATPFDDDMPGVEIIATAISQLLGGESLRRDTVTRRWDGAHAAALTLAGTFVVLSLPLAQSIPVAIGALVLSFAVTTGFFAYGLWLSAALPLAGAVPPMVIAGGYRYLQERARAAQSERAAASLRRFQSPALARKLEEDPEYLATPQSQDLVVYFVDLTGFTGLSQRLGTEGTRELLGLFHELTGKTVEARGGSVFNYMGDGAMAVFGLDEGAAGSASDAALAAAIDLVRALAEQSLREASNEILRCRIGLHKGPATLSRLGADSYQQVTVSGDTVNLSSRLMEVAKDQAAVIVASKDFAIALSDPTLLTTARETDVQIRGRDGSVSVYVWSPASV